MRVTPILKKTSADPNGVTSYRPISKLTTLSKLLERVVCTQLCDLAGKYDILPATQSAYRPHFSTESAVLKFLSDSLLSFDKGNVTLACFLDLSAAFDCVDHSTLLRRLRASVGLTGSVIDWFESFLTDRSISVIQRSCTPFVPQLGPLLFSIYISDLAQIVQRHNLQIHLFADDILIYGASGKQGLQNLSSRVSLCLDDVLQWLKCNKLLLNTEKTKFMWCHSSRLKPILPSSIRMGNVGLAPVPSILYLGVNLY